ncbi:dihydrofolate reductase [Streptococcus macacae]|nr:dihydrofolate reductase [Streptococcus macacae]
MNDSQKKRIVAIWAEDSHHLIGVQGKLPWHLPKELKHFKETTMNQALLMGRVTFDGMNRRILPGRDTLVLTRDPQFKAEGVTAVHSVKEALSWFRQQDKTLFIVGGASIYKAFENYYDEIIRTSVQGQFEGDTYFPSIDLSHFQKISQRFFERDEQNAYDFTVAVFKKKE